ncbi:MAG TPA: glycoside hydrolase family 15 protein [Candidatus Saccharimonadales bacterium]|nr:glycoside hydrolase family 15 protein [Candidatus Saccharimonadales bacterium]
MLGNGSLTVGLNEHGLVHDFYYPYVGLDNLTTARSVHHKIGVWVDGTFSWIDDGTWDISVDFETDALVSAITMTHQDYGVSLTANDFVDNDLNVLCRRITVKNLSRTHRTIRLFMHQVFEISRAGRGDTALYVPEEHYILDYKGRVSLLVYGETDSGASFDQFSIGSYGIEGKQGTYIDAEDGELSDNPVEHGGVDSVLRFSFDLAGHKSDVLNYWVVAADSQSSAERIHHKLKKDGLPHRLELARTYWNDWLQIAGPRLKLIDPAYTDMVKKSLMVIKAHTDKRGGIIASCDSSIYNYGRDYYSYVWPRDGAYAIWPLIRLGYTEEAKQFFAFCRDIMNPDGYLMHKYQPDKAIGSTWHPLVHGKRTELAIQEDETASVIYMLGEFYTHSQDNEYVRGLYATLIQPAANFMAGFMDDQTGLPHASYDLWEEKFLTNTYTAAVTYQALLVAAEFADLFEYPDNAVSWRQAAHRIVQQSDAFFDDERGAYCKGFLLGTDGSVTHDNTLDVSSLYGVVMYGLKAINAPEVTSTIKAVEERLLDRSPSGGSPRYEDDYYFRTNAPYAGNPWFVTSLWIAQYYIKAGRYEHARGIMQWTLDRALPSGILSEQVHPETSAPLSVTPLVWSHAEFINTAIDLIPRTK